MRRCSFTAAEQHLSEDAVQHWPGSSEAVCSLGSILAAFGVRSTGPSGGGNVLLGADRAREQTTSENTVDLRTSGLAVVRLLVSWVLWARADRVNAADVIQHAVTARRKVDEVAVLSGNRTWPRVGDSGTPTTGTTRNNLTPSSAAQHQLITRGQSSVGSAHGSRRWPTRRTPAEPARGRQTVHESGRPVPRAGR